MSATYTWDVYATVDGFGSFSGGDWGGYWGKQGPELLAHRAAVLAPDQRLVLGATTFRDFVHLLGAGPEDVPGDEVSTRMKRMPITVVSDSLDEPLPWPNATLERGDAVDVVARRKRESPVPLRSHGSLSTNRALMAAGLVDVLQVTVFPVITGLTGTAPVLAGAADFDLELLGSRTFDGRTVELTYRPRLRR